METRVPPPLLALALVALGWGIDHLTPGWRMDFPGRSALAVAVAGLGVGCILVGMLAFRSVGTTIDPLHPDRASQLVIAGIYRHTRNPMYLGLLLLISAWVTWLAQPFGAVLPLVWIALITQLQIRPEEAALRRLFGASYVAYCSQVRRWI